MTVLETKMEDTVATKEWVRTEIEDKLKKHVKEHFATKSWVFWTVLSILGTVAAIVLATRLLPP